MNKHRKLCFAQDITNTAGWELNILYLTQYLHAKAKDFGCLINMYITLIDTAFLGLRRFGTIWHYLTVGATKTSPLSPSSPPPHLYFFLTWPWTWYYQNCLQSLTFWIHRVQNCSARLEVLPPPSIKIMAICIQLHWLHVKVWISCRTACLSVNAIKCSNSRLSLWSPTTDCI